MTYFRFGIRDLLWGMVAVGLAVGWWSDRSHLADGLEVLVDHIYPGPR